MTIAIPYFGDLARFRPLVDEWFRAFHMAGLSFEQLPVIIISDDIEAAKAAYSHRCQFKLVSLAGFEDVIRPGQPFDVKGAIVCAYLLTTQEPVLVLDADAVLHADPRPILRKLPAGCELAMPVDAGALVHYRMPNLEAPFKEVRKMCAGVMFFGIGRRNLLVVHYRGAFSVMRKTIPWKPCLPHLVEQYAWSAVHYCRIPGDGGTLPHSMNWNTRYLGELPGMVIHHDYGHRKWQGEKAPRNS